MKYTQLFINNQEIPLSGKDKIALIFVLNDLRKINAREANYSRSIVVPASKITDQVFGMCFDVNVESGSFNPNAPADAEIRVNGIPQVIGFAQLTSFIQNGFDRQYTIEVFSGIANFAHKALGDLLLTDLDLSSYTHVWDESSVSGSWSHTPDQGYVYSLIEYGRIGNRLPTDTLAVDDLYPGIFFKTIVKEILKAQGYNLAGTFFEHPEYSGLKYPFSLPKFARSDKWKTDRDFTGATGAISHIQNPGDPNYYLPFNNTVTGNNKGLLSGTTFTADEPMQVTFNFQFDISTPFSGSMQFAIELNGSIVTALSNIYTGRTSYSNEPGSFSILLNTGDHIRIFFETNFNAGTITSFNIQSDISSLYQIGSVIDLSTTLPPMKQQDFLKAIFQMAFLYIRVDDNIQTVYLDAYRDFYKKPNGSDPNSFVKWNIDLHGPIEQKYFFEDNSKYGRNNYFKYQIDTNDPHIANDTRTNPFALKYPTQSMGYGCGVFELDNYFVQQDYDAANIPFAGTWMQKVYRGGALQLPEILYWVDQGGSFSQVGSPIPRVLLYYGLVDVSILSGGAQTSFRFGTITPTDYTQVPYSYYWKPQYNDSNLDARTLNLYFDDPKVQYGDTLLSRFYPEVISLIKNMRFIRCWVMLSEVDIANLDFTKMIWIDHFRAWFMLNRINQYTANDYESSEVELIKAP